MYYTHKKSGVTYKFIQIALLQSDKGVWGDCIIYENKDGMTFVREKSDWEKSFTKINGLSDLKKLTKTNYGRI